MTHMGRFSKPYGAGSTPARAPLTVGLGALPSFGPGRALLDERGHERLRRERPGARPRRCNQVALLLAAAKDGERPRDAPANLDFVISTLSRRLAPRVCN